MSLPVPQFPQQLGDYAKFVEQKLKPEFDVVQLEAQTIRNEIQDYRDLEYRLQSLLQQQEETANVESSNNYEDTASFEPIETLVDLVRFIVPGSRPDLVACGRFSFFTYSCWFLSCSFLFVINSVGL
jgi:hypothetical protein